MAEDARICLCLIAAGKSTDIRCNRVEIFLSCQHSMIETPKEDDVFQ
jgi:hypothetical protein